MLNCEIKVETVLTKSGEDRSLWFHPRVAAIPGGDAGDPPVVVMTLSKHLVADDHYSEMGSHL